MGVEKSRRARLVLCRQISIWCLFRVISLSKILITVFFEIFAFGFFSQNAFAAPSPITLTTTVSIPTVDLDFTPTGVNPAQFKESSVSLHVQTNNSTGVSTYISSIDEDIDLHHSDSTITQKISSIASELLSTDFSPKSWGYRVLNTTPNTFKPIPKASAAEVIMKTNDNKPYNVGVSFGVKMASDLISGTYSKKIVFTSITNYVPKTATFIPGQSFNNIVKKLNTNYDTENFKRSASQPATLSAAKVVSTPDSEYPIYVWYDVANKTILWWSEAEIAYANDDAKGMFADLNSGHGDINLIDVSEINMSKTRNMSYLFYGGNYLVKDIKFGDFESENVEDMSYMFATNNNTSTTVASLDFSKIKTANVKYMRHMFEGSHLTSMDLSNFDTSKVQDMTAMFANTKYLTSLNLLSFDTSKVTDMKNMFRYAGALTSLDLSSFDTGEVTNMRSMFGHMKSLTSLDISRFKTNKVTDMSGMFLNVEKLTKLDLVNFDTSEVTNMRSMFQNMTELKDLNVSTFNTSKVTDMAYMFYKSMMNPTDSILDLSSFNTQNVNSMTSMFFYSKIKTIYASLKFVTSQVAASQEIFKDNEKLKGGNGTAYSDGNPRDKTYARIDRAGQPGYFTAKP